MKNSFSIAKITFGDLIRHPEVLIVSVLGIIFIAGVSMVLLDEELAKQVTQGVRESQGIEIGKQTFIEGGLVYAEIFTMIATFLIGMNLIGSDIRSNAISLYLVKPITRKQYLLGKLSGGIMLSTVIFLFYVIFLAAALQFAGGGLNIPFFKIMFLTLFKIIILYSFIILFVQKTPGFVAALIGSIIYIGGYFATDFYLVSINAEGIVKLASTLVYYVLPHLVEVSPGSIMDASTGFSVFLQWVIIYGIMYSGICLYGAIRMFNRRQI